MSRVGKHPVPIPSGVTVNITQSMVEVQGKLGKISILIPPQVKVEQKDNAVSVIPQGTDQISRSMWGTIQRQIKTAVHGVSVGATVNLELSGVGYRASVQGSNIVLQLGFSHDVKYPIPTGVTVVCEKPTSIAITGPSKQQVGQIAAELRKYRKPEPYKGKGVIRQNEFVLRKEGKKK